MQPLVVHAHDPHGVAVAATAIGYGGLAVKPTLVASRRVDFPLKLNALSQWKYRQVAAFLCASECIRQILIGQGIPRERAVTVHEGIDLAHVDAAPPASVREAFWLPTNAPIVGCVGALVEHKGHRHLVHAAVDIVRAVPESRVVILGEGDLRDDLTRMIPRAGARAARPAPRLPARRAVAPQDRRRVRDAVDHRGPRDVDPRRHGLRHAGRGERGRRQN